MTIFGIITRNTFNNSTSMPSIGLVMFKIGVKIWIILDTKTLFHGKTNSCVLLELRNFEYRLTYESWAPEHG